MPLSDDLPFDEHILRLQDRVKGLEDAQNPVQHFRALVEDMLEYGCDLSFIQREALSDVMYPIAIGRRRVKILFGDAASREIREIMIDTVHRLLPDAPVIQSKMSLEAFEAKKEALETIVETLVTNLKFCTEVRRISPEMPDDLGQLLQEHAQQALSVTDTCLRGEPVRSHYFFYLMVALQNRGIISNEQFELFYESDEI